MSYLVKSGASSIPGVGTTKGNITYANDGDAADFGPTSITGFYRGIDRPDGGYVIYSNDTVSGPITAVVAHDDNELVYWLKSFGATGTTKSEVLAWASAYNGIDVDDASTVGGGGPTIVTSGLTLNLDAGNASSYSGTGTAWNDLSGNGYTATMTSSNPTFVSNGAASYFNLSNNNKYIYNHDTSVQGFTFATNTGIPQTNGFTIEFMYYISSYNFGNGQNPIFLNTGTGDGYRFGILNDGSLYFMLGDGSGTDNATVGNGSVTVGAWYHIVGVFDRTNALGGGVNIYAYSNGISKGSTGISPRSGMSLAAPNISYDGCCSAFDGRLNTLRVYNRALTSGEVIQNYNATCSRFGLSPIGGGSRYNYLANNGMVPDSAACNSTNGLTNVTFDTGDISNAGYIYADNMNTLSGGIYWIYDNVSGKVRGASYSGNGNNYMNFYGSATTPC